MLVIVGHGPSILCGLGSVIDSNTVIRLKQGLGTKPPSPAVHFGTRTDYLCARSLIYRHEHDPTPFWHFSDESPEGQYWNRYYKEFSPRIKIKPSTGLCAVFCAIDRLKPNTIGMIGFDRIFNPDDHTTHKWYKKGKDAQWFGWGHDAHAEQRCLMSLDVHIINLAEQHRELSDQAKEAPAKEA